MAPITRGAVETAKAELEPSAGQKGENGTMEQYRLLMTSAVAERYGVDPRTVRNWAKAGLFPGALQVGKKGRGAIWLIPEADLVGFEPPRVGRPPADQDPEGDPETPESDT